ncbi:MAG: hypothetical protein Q9170_006750 [Blastenia crenularia]
MGWFSSTPSPSSPQPTKDGAFIAPGRSARDRCYETRDAFFECLDQANIVDSIKEADKAEAACGKLERGMEKECAASWVKYFKQRRVMEWKKQKTYEKLAAEGAIGMPENLAIPSGLGLGVLGMANLHHFIVYGVAFRKDGGDNIEEAEQKKSK